jgi:hypothetical protein
LKKKIDIKVEVIPNYLWSLFASANLWEKQSARNCPSYHKQDIEFLYQYRQFIRWGNGRCGIFTHLAFFYPLSEKELTPLEYFELLEKMKVDIIEENPFIFERLYFQTENPHDELQVVKTIFLEFMEIFNRNVSIYEKEQWHYYQKVLNEIKIYSENELNEYDIITKWEKFLEIDFPADSFQIILTHANENLPSGNNLSKFRYNFHMNDNLQHFLEHEIGTNLLHDSLNALRKDALLNKDFIKDNNVLWLAFESLAEYFRGIIFKRRDEWDGEMFGGGKYHFDWFFDYYEKSIELPLAKNPITIMKEATLAFQDAFKDKISKKNT